MMSRTRGAWTSVLLVLFLTACGGPQPTEKLLESPERRYGKSVLPEADALPEGWSERDRAIVAYTRYDEVDAIDGEGEALPAFAEKSRTLIGPDAPSRIGCAVLYDHAATGGGVRAHYWFQNYRALPLMGKNELPAEDARIWILGGDGIAFGARQNDWNKWVMGSESRPQAPELTEAPGEEPILFASAASPLAHEMAHGEANGSAPDLVIDDVTADTAAAALATADASAATTVTDETGGASATNAVAELPNDVTEATAEPNADATDEDETGAGEDKLSEADPEAVDGEGEDTTVESESNREAESLEPEPTFWLAVNGMLAEVYVEGDVSVPEVQRLLGAMRAALAARLKEEHEFRQELAEKRRNQRGGVEVRYVSNPETRIYWELLEKAGGKVYETEY